MKSRDGHIGIKDFSGDLIRQRWAKQSLVRKCQGGVLYDYQETDSTPLGDRSAR